MRLLDLFCGAGGCAMGYSRAGFTSIVGVDIRPQPRYPFSFVQADALEYLAEHGREFDAIHASPPCQAFSSMQFLNPGATDRHPDLIEPTRGLLEHTGRPWVIENVPRAPMPGAVTVCGSAFGLNVRRHRLFMSSIFLFGTTCRHAAQKGTFKSGTGPNLRAGRRKSTSSVVAVWGGTGGGKELKAVWQEAMGIDWMTRPEMAQAIPPAFTEFIGRQLAGHVRHLPPGKVRASKE